MKFDTIIIGGGLAGLTAGIKLVEAGQNVAIVSAGQSALHFNSGSFELLGDSDTKGNASFETRFKSLPENHIYRKIGLDKIHELMDEVKPSMEKIGIKLQGEPGKAGWRLTPTGLFKPAWLTLEDHLMVDDPDHLPFKKAAIVNVKGYIDFYPQFITSGLRSKGVECIQSTFDTPAIDTLRQSTTEMRSSTMARVMTPDQVELMADELKMKSRDCDAVFVPAILGLYSPQEVRLLRQKMDKPVYLVPTIPANVPGVRAQIMHRRYFQQIGGTYFLGDTVTTGIVEGGILKQLQTDNLGEMPISADNFIFASGSFFSNGIVANIDRVFEPVLGLDVNADGGRTTWYDKNYYSDQPYMSFGLKTDRDFHPCKDGRTLDNVYAAGSVIGGVNHLKEQSGGGTTLLSALYVADQILKKK